MPVVIWQIGQHYKSNRAAMREFIRTRKNVKVFNYNVTADPNSKTSPKCPGGLYKVGYPVGPKGLARSGMHTAKLNIVFRLDRPYAANELLLQYGRFGTDVDHVHLDGKRIGVVRGVGEGKWRIWRRRFPRMGKGRHVLTLTTHGGLGNCHWIDYLRLVGPAEPKPVDPPPEVTEPPINPPLEPGPEPEPEPEALIAISFINYDGEESRTEGDEYVELTNSGDLAGDISGWKLHADDGGQDFTFPEGTVLDPGQSIRVYTNRDDPETGGFSFGSGRAIWNNKGDLGALFDAEDELVATYGYGAMAPPQEETDEGAEETDEITE